VLQRELGDLSKLSKADGAAVEAAQHEAKEFVTQLYRRVPVLDSGARGATNTFVQREIGDVLLTWENEALLAVNELGPDKVEVVVPEISILAAPPVALIDQVVDRRGTREVAQAYLEFLYTEQGQQLAAKHHFRPSQPELVSKEAIAQFPEVRLFTIEAAFGGWQKAQKEHFDDGGLFDQIYQPGAR
jgi:sulfate transport system substrate-binding protein